MAVMTELHRLPQCERQLIQKLKTSISEIQELTKLSGFTRVMSDIAHQALELPTPDGQSSAFILKGELQQISNQIVELNDSLNATMHGHLEDMEASFKSLTTTPDGSPFEMFSRAVDFTSRPGFCFSFSLKKKKTPGGGTKNAFFPPLTRQSADDDSRFILSFFFLSECDASLDVRCIHSGPPSSHVVDSRDDEMLRLAGHSFLIHDSLIFLCGLVLTLRP